MTGSEANNKWFSRQKFTAYSAALALSLPLTNAVFAGARDAQANRTGRTVKFHDGTVVPTLGQGSWHLGQGRHPAVSEEEALRAGLSLGMTLIDTSGNYGEGRSEELTNHVIAGQRDSVFLVSKVETNQVLRWHRARW